MKDKLLNVARSRYIPYILYAVLMIVLHIYITTDFGDDVYFRTVLDKYELFDYLIHRYNTWSSRMLIEISMITFSRVVTLWKILDVAVMVWIAIAFSLMFNTDKKLSVDWYIILMLLSFPFATMNTAGWIATTVNYTWCVAFGLLAFMPLRNAIMGKRTPWYLYIAALLAHAYASCQEQMCAVMIAICAAVGGYIFWKTKKIPYFALVQTLISIGMLLFILTCPGNDSRVEKEIVQWFPEFANYSFLHKIELGYSRAMYEFIMKQNAVFMLFSATLMIAVVVYNKNVALRIISAIPFVVSLFMGPFAVITKTCFPVLEKLRNSLTEAGSGLVLSAPGTWVPILFVTAVAACVLISVYAVFKNSAFTLFCAYILAVGLATAWVMGFSPTVWASQGRTFTYMYMTFAAVGILLFKEIQKSSIDHGTKAIGSIYCAVQSLLVFDMYVNLFYN